MAAAEEKQARPTDPHRALKHGLRTAFGRMAEKQVAKVWLSVPAVQRPPTAKEMLQILGYATWDEAAAGLGGNPRLGPDLARRKTLLCTDKTFCFKRLPLGETWPREKWLGILRALFSQRDKVFTVPAQYAFHFPIVELRMLTPRPWKQMAPSEEWARWPDGHEEVRVLRRMEIHAHECVV